MQERSDLRHALLNVSVNLNPALRREVCCHKDVNVGFGPREQKPFPNTVQRDSALSSVARVDIVIAFRVVEFLDAGRDDPISRHRLPEIDGGLGYV